MTATGEGERAPTAHLELDREEFGLLLVHVETQLGELQQALVNMQDGGGESVMRWNATRNLERRVDLLQDLSMKMHGAAKDAGWE